jgi:hypothetical protein
MHNKRTATPVFVATLLLVLAYSSAVVASDAAPLSAFMLLLAPYTASLLSLWLVTGLLYALGACVVIGIKHRFGPSPVKLIREYLLARWGQDRMASLVLPPIICALLLAAFNTFKQLVLVQAGFHADPFLAALDRSLFLGVDPWRITHVVASTPTATLFIDRAYHGWFVPTAIGVVLCAYATQRPRLAAQYLLSYALAWIVIGSVLAYLIPSAGPCFVAETSHSDAYAELMALLREQNHVLQANYGRGLTALWNQDMLLSHLGSRTIALGGGISAMPSMHNALSVLFAIAGFKLNRWLGAVLWGYAALIFFGSVHLGWHYAVDGIAAAILIAGIWKLSGTACDRLETFAATGARRFAETRAREISV